MDQLIAVAQQLRQVHHYNGYIHLKAVPGASEEAMAQAGRYADRLSANVELPTDADLAQLAPEKTMASVHETMNQIRRRIDISRGERAESSSAPRYAPAGQSTQMIVGATPSSDAAILSTASALYERQQLRRVYYSAYSPIDHADNRLPAQPPPLVREHRLYQADWLMRFYGFSASELTSPSEPNLDLKLDPKLAWALRHRDFFPVDVNQAPRPALLRVPGIGARNVGRILAIRRHHRLTLADLGKLRIVLAKTRPFVVTADANPDALRVDRSDLEARVTPAHQQLELFTAATSAASGEV